jgi:uncharacterized protein (DUF934 family)
MASNIFIQTTAGNIATELTRQGIAPDERVVVLRLADWLAEVRRDSRTRVVAAGLSDEDIDRLIKEERKAVQPFIK